MPTDVRRQCCTKNRTKLKNTPKLRKSTKSPVLPGIYRCRLIGANRSSYQSAKMLHEAGGAIQTACHRKVGICLSSTRLPPPASPSAAPSELYPKDESGAIARRCTELHVTEKTYCVADEMRAAVRCTPLQILPIPLTPRLSPRTQHPPRRHSANGLSSECRVLNLLSLRY